MTNAELLAEIERLEKAATPGPWKASKSLHGNKYRVVQFGPNADYTTLEIEPADARLIATLRNNLPAILSALRGVEAAREALSVPEVWSQVERDGMAAAFDKADGRHGHYETLFAVASWLLRHRLAALSEVTP